MIRVPRDAEAPDALPDATPGLAAGPLGMIEAVPRPVEEIDVVLGRSRLFDVKQKLTQIIVSTPAVAEVQLLDADRPSPRMNIYGKGFGTTDLTIFDSQNRPTSYLIRVKIDEHDLEKRLRRIFPGAELRIKQVASQIILEGQVPDAKTMAEVLQLVTAELRGNEALGLATGVGLSATVPAANAGGQPGNNPPPPPEAVPGDAQGVAPALGTPYQGVNLAGPNFSSVAGGVPSQATNVVGGNFTGTQSNPVPTRGGGGALPPGTIINRVHVPGPRQVLLHVKIAELNRTALREIGVNWLDARNNAVLGSTVGGIANISGTLTAGQNAAFTPGQFTTRSGTFPLRAPSAIQPVASTFGSTGTATTNGVQQLFGIFNAGEFSLFINALRSNSLAKILAEPNLVTLDGQPARFLAGGKFPYPVVTAAQGGVPIVTIQFANFGAILQFLPNILANDVIRLDVEPVFSELNPGAGISVNGTSVPAINQRSARTVVEMREGQTLAIAGLIQNRTSGSTTRIPGLGDLPIVGNLFSRTTFTALETELVVLVTPELVAPMEKCDVPPAPGDLLLEPNDCEFYFLGRIEGKTGHPFRSTVQELDPFNVMKHFRSENRWVVGPHGFAD